MTLGRHGNTECHLSQKSQKVPVCTTFLCLWAKSKEQTMQESLLGGLEVTGSVCSRAWETMPSRSVLGCGGEGGALTLPSPILNFDVSRGTGVSSMVVNDLQLSTCPLTPSSSDRREIQRVRHDRHLLTSSGTSRSPMAQ